MVKESWVVPASLVVLAGLMSHVWFGSAVQYLEAGAVSGTASSANAQTVLPRSATDRTDDNLRAKQIHVMYVVPSDGVDRQFDTNGSVGTSVAAFQNWLHGQTTGKRLRMDTYQGSLDATFVRLARTDAELQADAMAMGSLLYMRDILERELDALGFNDSRKIYAVYYDGGSGVPACGGASWPPTLQGNVVAQYLLACPANSFTTSEVTQGYLEMAMIHEIFHALGVVSSCAPNHTRAGHVSDSANDLMYAGDNPWLPSGYGNAVLDGGHDDYYSLPKKKACPSQVDVAKSAFLEIVN